MPDYYTILEISKSAGNAEIKRAYKRLALKYHPDRNPSNIYAEEHFKKINEAYQVLSNENKKLIYDYQMAYADPVYTSSVSYNTENYQAQTHGPYKPYINDYDPANHISEATKRKIHWFTGGAFVAILIFSYFFMIFMNKRNAYILYKQAAELKEENHQRYALLKIEQALKYNPKLSEAYTLRGDIHLSLYNHYYAREDYTKALQYNKDKHKRSDLYYKRGMTYFKMYQFKNSIQDFDKAIKDDPSQEIYYLFRAKANSKLDSPSKNICADLGKVTQIEKKEVENLKKIYCK